MPTTISDATPNAFADVAAVNHLNLAPVHVIGHGRSGTSILIRLLREYLQIGFGTESQFIIRFLNRLGDYGDLTVESNRRRLVTHICDERWFQRCHKRLGFATTPDAILADVVAPTYRGILDATFGQLAKHLRMRRWGDKTPEYIHHLPELYGLFPDARFIHMVRDGRDVALSGFEMPFGEKNIFSAAVDWSRAMQQIREFSQSLPKGSLLEVRYEDFLQRPVQQFARIIEFLEIDPDGGRLLERIDEQVSRDLKQGNFDKWRTRLTSRQIARFDRIAWSNLRHFGYETSVSGAAPPPRLTSWFWKFDNKLRKLMRADYWSDNFYKAGLRVREYSAT